MAPETQMTRMTQVTPIHRLLIANRGEIARRVQRSAHEMGIATVAIYSEGDADAPFVREADVAVALRGRTSAETYLDVEQVLEAARRTGADAVHPGYGFLSENAGFARAVADAGLIWVGPSPEAIEAMGDKIEAKRRLADSGVPLLPSVELEDSDGSGDADAIAAALEQVGLPLLVKASAGGGGKGMRVVRSADELTEAVAAARREALAAFGDDRVFLERYVARSRHVELQLLGDRHGNLVHCFERECSIQRRHQKVVEEAPSPALDAELRAAMGDAAVRAGAAIGYDSAGTVEFLLEEPEDGAADTTPQFYFLEVNTRLQVEHPVTEAITGLDLVRQQLLVAQGETLCFTQDDLAIDGHAIEVRLYAEDPANDFLPATGELVSFEPATGAGLRFDAGVETGSVVGIEFDPMLAKVIAHGPTRREAALRLARGLEGTRVQGLVTNRDFLVATLRSEAFLAGDTTTDFIERVGVAPQRVPGDEELAEAALLVAFAAQQRRRAAAGVHRSVPLGFRNSAMPPEELRLRSRDGREVLVQYRARRGSGFDAWTTVTATDQGDEPDLAAIAEAMCRVTPDGDALDVVVAGFDNGTVDLVVDGRRVRGAVQGDHTLDDGRGTGDVWVGTELGDLCLAAVPRFPEVGGAGKKGGLVSPMPGKVLRVEVAAGDTVEEGQLLLVLEAMKMEHRVTAPSAGVVAELRVAAEDQVLGGELLARIESDD